MPAASGTRDLHVDKLLSNMAVNYRPEGMIIDQVFPLVNVNKQADYYAVFERGEKMRRQDTRRAPGAEARQIFMSVGSGAFFAPNYALKMPVTIEDRVNADPIYVDELINGRTQFILDHLLLDWEVRGSALALAGVGSSAAVTSAWNGAGHPLTDIHTAIDNVHYSNGMRPNHVVFGLDAWKSFRRDSSVRNIIFGTNNGGGYPNTSQVGEVLEVENVLVGGAFQNTGQEGQNETLARVWGDHVLVYYAPESATTERPSFGYSFRWSANGLPNMQVERHPFDVKTKSEEIEVGYYQDEKITGASYGFKLTAVNSST